MSDLGYVSPGQPFRPNAGQWNAFVDAAKFVRGQRISRQSRGPVPTADIAARDVVTVRNQSGANIKRGRVLGIKGIVFDPTSFTDLLRLNGETPDIDDHRGKFVVSIESIKRGHMGRAVVAGIAKVKLYVNDEDDRFAEIEDSTSDYLATGKFGSAQILWKESGTGEKWGVVRIGSGDGGFLIGKLDAQLDFEDSATMSIWGGDAGSESDSGEDVTVYDWLLSSGQSISTGKKVLAASIGGVWYVIAAECES